MAKNNNKIINFAEKKAQMKNKNGAVPLVVRNDALNAGLDVFRENQSRENMVKLLNLLIPASVLVTVKLDEERRPLGLLIKDNNSGKMIQPVFTDNGKLPAVEKMGYQGIMRIPFLDVVRSCSANDSISGDVIINCEHHNITLRRELLLNVLKFAEEHRGDDGKVDEITAEYLDGVMPARKVLHRLENGRVVDVEVGKVDPQETSDVKNPELNELVAECHNDFKPEKLNEVIRCITGCRVLLPAKMNEKNIPVPLSIKDPNGKLFQPIFGDKEQIPENMNGQVTMNLPFMGIVKMLVETPNEIEGVVVNPKCGITLGKPLLEKIYENNGISSPQQKRIDYERKVLPSQLFEDGDELIESLINQKGEYLALDYESTLGGSESEYDESDYSVMIISPADGMEMAIIKLPKKGLVPQVATDIYIVWDKIKRKGHYFVWGLSGDSKTREVVEITEDMKSINHGPAPAEGTEMNWVLEKIRK